MRENNGLGKYIAGRRKYLGLTQEELAEKVGVSKSAIAKWETNGGLPDRDNLKRLSDAINVSVDDMHRVINHGKYSDIESDINITGEVISVFESYGYKLVRTTE